MWVNGCVWAKYHRGHVKVRGQTIHGNYLFPQCGFQNLALLVLLLYIFSSYPPNTLLSSSICSPNLMFFKKNLDLFLFMCIFMGLCEYKPHMWVPTEIKRVLDPLELELWVYWEPNSGPGVSRGTLNCVILSTPIFLDFWGTSTLIFIVVVPVYVYFSLKIESFPFPMYSSAFIVSFFFLIFSLSLSVSPRS